jgi:small-conductance mechanosensitive channel
MAKNQTRPVRPALLAADRDAFDALQGIENYAPANQAYTVANVKALRDRLDEAQREATQAQAEADAKRDAEVAAAWAFHNAMLGVKVQVNAQFGSDSDQVASLGMKKRSEYKRPVRRKTGNGGPPK